MPDGEGQLKIFDINLRQNFYTKEVLCQSMQKCNILKINDEELVTISRMFGYPGIGPARQVLDSAGQVRLEDAHPDLWRKRQLCLYAGTCVVPGNAQGRGGRHGKARGDSFTAAFVSGVLRGMPIEEAHRLAVYTSAYVCTQNGAMPQLPRELTGWKQ